MQWNDMQALIDGDLVLYRCAASAENDSLDIAKHRVNELLDQIIEAIMATEYRFFRIGYGPIGGGLYGDDGYGN